MVTWAAKRLQRKRGRPQRAHSRAEQGPASSQPLPTGRWSPNQSISTKVYLSVDISTKVYQPKMYLSITQPKYIDQDISLLIYQPRYINQNISFSWYINLSISTSNQNYICHMSSKYCGPCESTTPTTTGCWSHGEANNNRIYSHIYWGDQFPLCLYGLMRVDKVQALFGCWV